MEDPCQATSEDLGEQNAALRQQIAAVLQEQLSTLLKERLTAALKETSAERMEAEIRALGDFCERLAPGWSLVQKANQADRPDLGYLRELAALARTHNVDLIVGDIEIVVNEVPPAPPARSGRRTGR